MYYARSRDGSKSGDIIRESAKRASERCANRAHEWHMKKKACSIYRTGSKILLRYSFGKRVPYKRYVLEGQVLQKKSVLRPVLRNVQKTK